MKIEIIQCLNDNYSYLIFEKTTNKVTIVDPSEFDACDKIIKKYEQDLSNAKFDVFSQKELSILGDITKSMKVIKNKKSNEIQLQIMNLENSGIAVNNFLEIYSQEYHSNKSTKPQL